LYGFGEQTLSPDANTKDTQLLSAELLRWLNYETKIHHPRHHCRRRCREFNSHQ